MKGLLVFLTFVALIVIGISFYLQPNDFSGCSDKPDSSCAAADAVVVVSGGDTKARAQKGIDLYKDGWAHTIVFSGAAQDKSGPSNAEAMRRQAVAAGVPTKSILIDEEAVNTQQNAENTQSILASNNIKTAILVTSGYHQRRASLELQKQTYDTGIVIRNWPVSSDKDWSQFWWATPRGWWLAGGELAKVVAFYTGAGR